MKRAPVVGLAAGVMTLTAETSHHLCRVLRMAPGDSFVAFDPDARVEADASLLGATEIRVGELRAASLVATTHVELIYSLSKGDKVDAVVRDATELGATRISVVRAARSVVKIDARGAEAKLERWSRIAVEAARQCGRSDPPALSLLDLEEALAAATGECRFVLHGRGARPIGELLRPVSSVFAIGPEGGFTDEEMAVSAKYGFEAVFLGRFTMRTETAPAAVLGAFLALVGDGR